jgi:hypothetical protein
LQSLWRSSVSRVLREAWLPHVSSFTQVQCHDAKLARLPQLIADERLTFAAAYVAWAASGQGVSLKAKTCFRIFHASQERPAV